MFQEMRGCLWCMVQKPMERCVDSDRTYSGFRSLFKYVVAFYSLL